MTMRLKSSFVTYVYMYIYSEQLYRIVFTGQRKSTNVYIVYIYVYIHRCDASVIFPDTSCWNYHTRKHILFWILLMNLKNQRFSIHSTISLKFYSRSWNSRIVIFFITLGRLLLSRDYMIIFLHTKGEASPPYPRLPVTYK